MTQDEAFTAAKPRLRMLNSSERLSYEVALPPRWVCSVPLEDQLKVTAASANRFIGIGSTPSDAYMRWAARTYPPHRQPPPQ